MAPVTEHQAIIVSHGSPSRPDVQEAEISRLAAHVAGRLPGWTVLGAALAAKGAFEAALARVENPLICPLFMAPGWFIDTHVPARLGGAAARLLPPLGSDPGLPELVRGEIAVALNALGVAIKDTTVVIAAHGSPSHPQSGAAVRRFAGQLNDLLRPRKIRIGFVEEAPFLREAARVSGPALCVPFFAISGGHVRCDIPEALTDAGFSGPVLPPLIGYRQLPGFVAGILTGAVGERCAA